MATSLCAWLICNIFLGICTHPPKSKSGFKCLIHTVEVWKAETEILIFPTSYLSLSWSLSAAHYVSVYLVTTANKPRSYSVFPFPLLPISSPSSQAAKFYLQKVSWIQHSPLPPSILVEAFLYRLSFCSQTLLLAAASVFSTRSCCFPTSHLSLLTKSEGRLSCSLSCLQCQEQYLIHGRPSGVREPIWTAIAHCVIHTSLLEETVTFLLPGFWEVRDRKGLSKPQESRRIA